MNDSQLNQSSINFNELDVDKILEFIKILEEHQLKCEKEGKFVEAEMARQRVNQLKKIEEDKLFLEKKIEFEQQKEELENDQRKELDAFNIEWDKRFFDLNNKFDEQETRLIEQQENELKLKLEECEAQFPKTVKPSIQVLDLNRMLEQVVKAKDYTQAHQIQIKIAELSEKDARKYEQEKENKLRKEFEKIKQKHEAEISAFNSKKNATIDNARKKRALEIIQKFKNKRKELDNLHNFQLKNFQKLRKGIARPVSRGSLILNRSKAE